MPSKLLFILMIFGSVFIGYAQEPDEEKSYYDMSLEELMQLKVSVASQRPLTTRESPGILTIISEEDIQNAGAQDLIDVFRLIPGITFGYDVQGITGLAARGNWGHEGKILLMIDGQEMNDIMYGTSQFGNHYDVNQIKRIEVIRGPGSSIYGGAAELGVINIITKSGKDIEGVMANAVYGQFDGGYARRNFSLGIGKSTDDLDMSLAAFIGEGRRSNQPFVDIFGNTGPMSNKSDLNPANINLGIKYKNLEFRSIYDNYRTSSIAIYDSLSNMGQDMNFKSWNTQLKYQLKLNEKFSLTPKFSYITQQPWQVVTNNAALYDYYRQIDVNYDITAQKIIGNIAANWEMGKNLNLMFGSEYFVEKAADNDPEIKGYFLGKNAIDFNTISGFAQFSYQSKYGNMTIGTRYVSHSQYGSAIAPRIAYTKVFGGFHTKLLYSRAYRAPNIENIITNPNLSPEETYVAEIELGYQLGKEMVVNLNFYDITIDHPIVYRYDQSTIYENFDQSGSRGVELVYQYRSTWGYLNINYSLSSAAGKNKVSIYDVDGNDNTLVGIPNSKFNFYSSVNLAQNISLNPSFTLIGERYGYSSIDDSNNAILQKFEPVSFFNLNLNFNNLLTQGLSLSVGGNNLLDEAFVFIQPYDGMHSPLPGSRREFVLSLRYRIPFEKK